MSQIDRTVESALKKIHQKNKNDKNEFHNLYDRIISSGEIHGKYLTPQQRHSLIPKLETDNQIVLAQANSSLYSSTTLTAPPLKKEKSVKPKGLGKGWFDLQPMEKDEALKRDLKMIQMRNYLDAKRFYKNPDRIGAVLHRGTVIAGPGESKANKLTRREQKQTIFEEIFSDRKIKDYSKKKYLEIQQEKSRKRKTFRKPLRSKNWK